MLLLPFGWKTVAPALIGPGLWALAGAVAALADGVNTQPESNILTIIVSVLSATGVIGWGFRAWVTAQIKRADEQRAAAAKEREQDREEDRLARERQREEGAAHLQLYIQERAQHEAYLLAQIAMLQERLDVERERSNRIVMQCLAGEPVVTHDDAV